MFDYRRVQNPRRPHMNSLFIIWVNHGLLNVDVIGARSSHQCRLFITRGPKENLRIRSEKNIELL